MKPDDTQTPTADVPVETTATDTAETQVSATSEQTSEAPEATQETVETTPTEVKAEETASEILYAGKYKTVEDLENAYKNAESKLGSTTSEKAELAKILNEAFQAPEAVVAAPAADDFEDEPNPVTQEIDGLKRVQAVQSFVMNHPEADAATMQKILAEDPIIRQISGHDAKLEYAYLRSQSMGQSKTIAEAEKKGAQAATAKVAEKQVAQVESARNVEVIEDGAELLTQASTGNPDERESARRALIKKHLVNL